MAYSANQRELVFIVADLVGGLACASRYGLGDSPVIRRQLVLQKVHTALASAVPLYAFI